MVVLQVKTPARAARYPWMGKSTANHYPWSSNPRPWGNAPPSMRRPNRRCLNFHPKESRCVAAENRRLVVITQDRGGEHVIDRMLLPRDRVVGAEHDLAGADLRREVAQRLRGEHQGVEMQLVQI